ncbi:DUF3810 domain-containing protein [Mucilaginibacter conchicola]|uniref:DUF3810 domain-containing protein n=1 Tax=Mucilaginibacter conchicola TaxID=2303333 RepID=A0A372NZK3_9SPHI|nr:DUF3810 domain-containing protein [Mucilaginibacter conchicola]RFZ95558.1 DUF3810 domain-containing protein [Mucilaginibacter conchicola]
MQRHNVKKAFIKRGIAILALFLISNLLFLFADHPAAVEKYYSKSTYRFICHVLHPIFNLFPFSVGDLVYLTVIIFLVIAVVKFIKHCFKKRWAEAGLLVLKVTIGVQSGILIFYVFWGLNYFRPSAAERLNLRDSTYTTAELQRVTAILIDSANSTRSRVRSADLQTGNDTIYSRAKQAIIALSNTSEEFKTYSPRIKPSMITFVMNYIGTSGYYNPFTGEAQMNYEMPVFNRPFVACHEMSHQMGYGPEDEANFVGYLAASGSKDRLLRYSAYNLAVGELMRTMRFTDTVIFKQLRETISPQVRADFKAERQYWLSYQTKLNAVSSVFYDNFLKANNQPQGLETYNRMVLLLMARYKRD